MSTPDTVTGKGEPEREPITPTQDQQKIADLLAKPGVKDALQRVIEEFNKLPGKPLFLGITSGGLFVAVREGVESATFSDKYFKGTVLDINLPPEEIDKARIDTSFSLADVKRYNDGGTTDFPGPYNSGYIRKFKDLPEEHARRELSKEWFSILKFHKATGGFHFPSPLREPGILPSVGKGTLYPLPL